MRRLSIGFDLKLLLINLETLYSHHSYSVYATTCLGAAQWVRGMITWLDR